MANKAIYPLVDITIDRTLEYLTVSTVVLNPSAPTQEIEVRSKDYSRRLLCLLPEVEKTNNKVTGVHEKSVLKILLSTNINGKNLANLGTVNLDVNSGDTSYNIRVNDHFDIDEILLEIRNLTI